MEDLVAERRPWYDGAVVLVTGAQGFIGSWLAERLLDGGARVRVLDRAAPPGSSFALRGLGERCEAVEADLLDVDGMAAALEGADAVFHLAARSIVGAATADPLETWEVNVRGTWTLLEACRSAGVERVLVASTDRAYGAGEGLPYREEHGLKARYPYDVSKACADMVARSYAATFGLPVGVVRAANVFGGGDANWSRLVPGTARALLAGEAPVIRSNGRMQRDFLYVEDLVDAYLAVAASLDDPARRGAAWNASLGHPVTVLEVVRCLIQVSGVEVDPDVRGEHFPHGEVPYQWLDSSALRRELDWRPRRTLEQGLEATYRWYARHLVAA